MMKKKKLSAIPVLFLGALTLYSSLAFSQEERKIELTAQGILARVDRILEYPAGQVLGRMKHVKPDGSSYTIEINASVTPEDFLFVFSSRERGESLKVLYNLGGEDIWVYNIHSIKLYHKLGIDKYDPIMATNFSFIDLSNYDLQSNYTAAITGNAMVKGYEAYKLVLKPIFKGGEYGLLTLYVTKDEFIPLRIDFHDRDNAIYKFMTIAKIKKKDDRIIPLRYDMMDIRTGTITILSFHSFDEDVKFKKEIFRSELLGE